MGTQSGDADVIVIGGGIAGVAAALRLKDCGLDPLVLEAESRVGGRMTTDRVNGFVIDRGVTLLEMDLCGCAGSCAAWDCRRLWAKEVSVWAFKMPRVAGVIAAGGLRICSSIAEYLCALASPACDSDSICCAIIALWSTAAAPSAVSLDGEHARAYSAGSAGKKYSSASSGLA